MNNDQPQIVKLTWPLVIGVFAAEVMAFVVAYCLYWYATHAGARPAHDGAQGANVSTPSDDIRAVLYKQNDAWNRGDLEGYMAGYWRDDGLQFYSGGDITHGWQPTLERFRRRYQADGKEMGQLTFSDVDVMPLASDAATVRGRWKLHFKDGKTSEGLYTLLMRRFDNDWRIVHDHSSGKTP